MPKIKQLSEELINKIAAGEVIDRPASVVKELIENALDSKATNILIEIKDAGQQLIRVSDNGVGMHREDAKKSILRHATSKIATLSDLFSINSLGFRGEALASIAAISHLTIITKEKDNVEGFEMRVVGGLVEREQVVGAQDGTTIEVTSLFFNTPARRKFLKSDLIELKHIIEMTTRYALANPTIGITLRNQGREILASPATMHSRGNIAAMYGTSIAKNLLEVQHFDGENKISIRGFISKPLSARNDKVQQTLFVNGRWVRNQDISKAIYDAYHSLLFHNKHPIYVLSITLDPTTIDVNVHPAKTEIKIEQKELMYKNVYDAIHETLRKNDLIPKFVDLKTDEQVTFGKPTHIKKEEGPKYMFEPSDQTVFDEKISESKPEEISQKEPTPYATQIPSLPVVMQHSTKYSNSITQQQQNSTQITETPRYDASGAGLPAMKILGQIHKTFFVAEIPGGMMLIDQHVVEERVNYEKFMHEFLDKHVSVQRLLNPEIITFSSSEKIVVDRHQKRLKDLGFELEHFGDNDFKLLTVPSLLGRVQPQELVHTIVEELAKGRVDEIEKVQEEIITRMACRASVKAGDTLTIPHMNKLITELSKCKLPYTCPHGRAIMIKISADELEKKFLRKG
jgi:DNA mismatch repair protein MutL